MLTGKEIKKEINNGNIFIGDYSESSVRECSYDVHLFSKGLILRNNKIDFREETTYDEIAIPETGLLLQPSYCYLFATSEVVNSNKFAIRLEGISSVARNFVQIHTAGLIEPGFKGRITLEVTVKYYTRVYPYMRIGQLCFVPLIGDVELYKGRYANAMEAEASKAHLDFKK